MNRTFLSLLTLFSCLALHAQTFRGTIAGNVADASGAAIPSASVKAVSTSTGLTRETLTTENGDFQLPDLPLGLYSVTVSKEGFSITKLDNVEVAVSRVTNIPVKLCGIL